MFDADTASLAKRLYGRARSDRDKHFKKHLESVKSNAVERHALGAGWYHKALAEAYAQEIRERGDAAWRVAQDAIASSDVPFDETTQRNLTEFIVGVLSIEAAELRQALEKEIARWKPPSWLLELVANEAEEATHGLHAEIELFCRRQRKARTDKPRAEVRLPDARRVFVVHGRDIKLKADVFSFLRALDLDPIEWNEAVRLTQKGAPYIGEALEAAFANAQAAVVLLSPDDEVRLTPELCRADDGPVEREIRLQPRPNVLFEAGMAFAFTRDRTIIVEVGSTKPFSDIAGRHTIRLSNDPERRKDFAERLKTAGCSVNPKNDTWLSVGNFENLRGEMASKDVQTPKRSIVKHVDINYPHDSGIAAHLKANGYRVAWVFDSKVARRLDIDGWSLATTMDNDGNEVAYKLTDHPENQTLLMKREQP